MTTYAFERRPRAPRVAKLYGPRRQTVAGLLVGLAAAATTVLLIGNGTMKAMAILIVLVGTIWFATTRRTELALALLMLYLGMLDGYLKLATGSNLATFVRDALLYAIVVGLLVRAIVERRRLPLPPMSAWVLLFSALVLAQLLNPADGTLFHSLAGVRQHLEFVPLFFLTYTYVRTTKALRTFVLLIVVIGAANGAVSWIQFRETPDQLASWGPGYAARILGTGGFQFAGRTFYDSSGQEFNRPFGLGSEAGDGGTMGAFALAGVLAIMALSRGRRRALVAAGAMGIAAVVAVYTSEGRGPVVASLVIVLVFTALASTTRGRFKTVLAVMVGGLLALFVIQQLVGGSGSGAFRYQGLTAASILKTTSNARGASYAQIPDNLRDHPFGAGLGVAGPAEGVSGAPALGGIVDAENEISYATVELGIPGMLVLIGFTGWLLTIGLLRIKREPDSEARILLAAIIAPIGGMLALYLVSAITSSTPSGPYLWAAGGIVAYWLVERPAELRRAPILPAGGGPLIGSAVAT